MSYHMIRRYMELHPCCDMAERWTTREKENPTSIINAFSMGLYHAQDQWLFERQRSRDYGRVETYFQWVREHPEWEGWRLGYVSLEDVCD